MAREKPEHVGRVAKKDTLQPRARKEATDICSLLLKMTVKTSKNQLATKNICKHGVCWKRVKMSSISRRDKQSAKTASQPSLLSAESSLNSSPKKIIEVNDRCVKARVTMDSEAARHVMREGMFPRVRLERKTSPKRFVAANDQRLGGKYFSTQDKRGISKVHNTQKCECCQTLSFQCRMLSELETLLCWMKGIRTFELFEKER